MKIIIQVILFLVLCLTPFAWAGLETGTYIDSLVTTNPTSSDPKSQGDDHLRLVKSTVTNTFPNLTGAVTPTQVELNYTDGVTSAIQTQIDTKTANLATLADDVDLDTVIVSGFYRLGATHTNAPPVYQYSQMLVCRGGGDTISQIIITYSSNRMFWRAGNPPDVGGVGTWNAWSEVADTTALALRALIANPTFTGEIGIGSVNVSETELGILEGATTTTAELNILDGVTSTTTEINYVDGVTSAIQTQINTKAPTANPTFTGEIGIGSVNVSETELGILEGATTTTTELNYVDGVTSAIQTQINTKAPTASPTLTGTPAAPTAAIGTSTTQIATTAFVESKSVLQTKRIAIGDWDMDADVFVQVAHGLTLSKITDISAIIIADNSALRYPLPIYRPTSEGLSASATEITLLRETGGFFDGSLFNSTSFNRGYIVIDYIN